MAPARCGILRLHRPGRVGYVARVASPLYVFIDESGNLDFSGRGTNHYVMSAYMTSDPIGCGRSISSLTYEFLARGLDDQVPFHATTNSVGTRKRVVGSLCSHGHCWVHSIYADKHLAHPSKHRPEVFYSLIGGALAKYLLKALAPDHDPVVLMFDSALSARQRGAFLRAVKPVLNQIGRRYWITFKPVREDPNGQIADFYAWSLFRSLEAGDGSWLSVLPGPRTEFDLFQSGHTKYW